MKYVSQGPLFVDVHMHRPHTTSRHFMDALLAFWPGLQVTYFRLKVEWTGILLNIPGPEVIKLLSCSTQLSMKFELLIYIEIAKVNENFGFKSPKPVIYPANKC